MTEEIPPAPPFRPLPKIVAKSPEVDPGELEPLQVGHRVNIFFPYKLGAKPFWRIYEVTIIDEDKCRLVTPDKKFHMIADTAAIKQFREVAAGPGVETREISMAAIKKQNGGTIGVALTREQINKALGEMVARHVVQLSEHLGCVQIIGTKLEADGSTTPFMFGSGDIYARAKVAESWLYSVHRHGQQEA